MTLRDLLAQYLEARKYFLAVARDRNEDEPDFDSTEAEQYMWDSHEAEKALRAALQKAHGLDPRYTTPRPIASMVDGYLICLVPDPNASCYPERGGVLAPDSWKDGDVFSVVAPEDVLTETKKAETRKDGRAGK